MDSPPHVKRAGNRISLLWRMANAIATDCQPLVPFLPDRLLPKTGKCCDFKPLGGFSGRLPHGGFLGGADG